MSGHAATGPSNPRRIAFALLYIRANGILDAHGRNDDHRRKITRAAARIALGLQQDLYLGNLDALRDWGHARDFVRAQWLILQQAEPDDYVIATGEQHSVREFCERSFAELGIQLEWKGKGVSEQGIIACISPSPLLEKYCKQCKLSAL